jgi:hypothetical protein
MARNARLPCKGGAAQLDMEMAFAAFLKACVTAMSFAVVAHHQFAWVKSRAQALFDVLGSAHVLSLRLCHSGPLHKTCPPHMPPLRFDVCAEGKHLCTLKRYVITHQVAKNMAKPHLTAATVTTPNSGRAA